MPPQSIYDPGYAAFGGGSTGSVLHPLVLALVILIGILVFLLPRRYVIIPLIFGILLIPRGQNLYIGGSHWYVFRLLILLGWARIAKIKLTSRTQLMPGRVNILDKLFLTWAGYKAISVILLFGEMGAVINQAAFLLDSIGGYFLFRCLVQDEEDILRVIKVFAVASVVVTAGMIYEHETARNMFAFLGGIRPVPEIRNGKIRAQAIFAHSLLAGSFGATTFPLFLWLWKRGKARFLASIGIVCSVMISFAALTSTPIATLAGTVAALFLFPIRKNMRLVRWGIVIAIIFLQLMMKAPFWFALARIDLVGGSTGWDRAMMIDNFVRHFWDWWLIGTHDNMNWGWDMWDQANQFVMEGETGGLVALTCFIAMISICFRWIGKARKAVEGDRSREWLFWLFGVALFAHVLAYFGIDYFDQSKFIWYVFLVMVSVVTLRPREALAPSLVMSRVPGAALARNVQAPRTT
jgi:hypothetical protein